MTDQPSVRSIAMQCDPLAVPPPEGTEHPK